MLAAEAGVLSDLSDLAQACARCFTAARCAGCDVRAITPPARAALALGAPMPSLYPDAQPYRSDSEYLDAAAEVRAAIRLHGQQVAALARRAAEQAEQAERAMRAALRQRPPDWAAWNLAHWSHQDARAAYETCEETDGRLGRGYRELCAAPAAFGESYELTERFAAAGGVLPHDGRFIAAANR